jgi:N-acetylmuramoyl-L-alanine amidase
VRLAVTVAVAALACRGGDGRPPSAGSPPRPIDDGAGAARGSVDGAPIDAGSIDAGSIDAAPIDAAPIDAAPIDAEPRATIIDRPVPWPREREALMLAYRRAHSDPAATDLTITPRLIVLHYTGGNSAEGTIGYFSRTRLEAERATLRRGGAANVVAHFVIDRDGTIYRLIPETRMGRHAIGVNHASIGVENVGDEARWPLTEAQVAANVALILDLADRHPIERVLGHHEVAALRGTADYVELVPGYKNAKGDPGARFMAAVRAGLGDRPYAAAP